ncbi:hypothetical protein SADUNF_Sadunf13G0124600 [Salix dunnii]|uniref:Uncharacterized protein n=1 Tax=Salix dunnii TaxID=1413687 RepID=A0A835MLG6_9ROSI|nr:hypothetical protein SADUNF_Sadunf13G0124600 [Salix dunnii]
MEIQGMTLSMACQVYFNYVIAWLAHDCVLIIEDYTYRALASHPSEECIDTVNCEGSADLKNEPERGKKLRLDSVGAQKEKKGRNRTINGGTLDEGHDKKDKPAGSEKAKFEGKDQCVVKPRKKRAERLFMRRARV